jgi:hypothetical protein
MRDVDDVKSFDVVGFVGPGGIGHCH